MKIVYLLGVYVCFQMSVVCSDSVFLYAFSACLRAFYALLKFCKNNVMIVP